jgi:hypothetical protein
MYLCPTYVIHLVCPTYVIHVVCPTYVMYVVCPVHLALLGMVTLTFFGKQKLRRSVLYTFVHRPATSHLHSLDAGPIGACACSYVVIAARNHKRSVVFNTAV